MKKILNLLSLKTIRNRIIAIQFCVIIPAIIIMGIVLYSLISDLLVETSSDSYNKILESSDVILNEYLDNYREISRNIMSDPDLQNELKKSNKIQEKSVLMNELSFVKLQKKISKYILGFNSIKSLYVYDNNGKLFYIDYGQLGEYVNKIYDYEEISQRDWFKHILNTDGYEKFYGYNVMENDGDNISCVKKIRDLETMETLGIMVLNFKKDSLNNVFPFSTGEKGAYGVIEKQGSQYNIVVLETFDTNIHSIIDSIITRSNEDYYLSTYTDKDTEWLLIYTIRQDDLVQEASKIRIIIAWGLSITILILLVLTIVICNNITRPLYQLKDNIIRVGEGTRYLQDSFPDDEIGLIGHEFNKMVNEKLALSDRITKIELKNKEAEIELLQSNINPHFLYNTLDSLYWMAIVEEVEDIAELTKSLSNIFRIALSGGEKEITIQKELEFVNSYLSIQNIRFEGKIKTELNVDERLLKQRIIKLLLQPFVENAVYHGLEPKRNGGTIKINIYQNKKNIIFEICDDGVGMEVEKALISGYALRNSIDRIRLVYGEKAFVRFESEIGNGVNVTISIPMEGTLC